METQQKSCKYFELGSHSALEIGGDSIPTIIPNSRPICTIDVIEYPASNLDWEKCKQTPFEGPCWQFVNKIKTSEEWNNWVNQYLAARNK